MSSSFFKIIYLQLLYPNFISIKIAGPHIDIKRRATDFRGDDAGRSASGFGQTGYNSQQ